MSDNAALVDVAGQAPIIASLDKADPSTAFAVTLRNNAAEAYNAILLKNAASSLSVEDLKVKVAETFTNDEVSNAREVIAKAEAALAKALAKADAEITALAEKAKADAGEPDAIAEAAAKKQFDAANTVLAMTPDGKNVDHFLIDVAKPGRRSIAKSGESGPKNDLGAVREWGRANGYEVKDRGRLNDDLVAAYNKANPATAIAAAE